MRVGLIGNMNNNFFGLTRYLRDMGYDAELLYPNDHDHFLPRADTFVTDYQSYCRELNWDQNAFYRTSDAAIEAVLAPFDRTITSYFAVAFLNKVGRKTDIYVPHGSDIYKYAFLRGAFTPYEKARKTLDRLLRKDRHFDMYRGTIARHLKEGIQNASYIIFAETNAEIEAKYDALCVKGTRLKFSIPFFYAPDYDPACMPRYYEQSRWYPAFKALREAYDVMVFHHARHTWKTLGIKGNDNLIRGFAEFTKTRRDLRACLVMMEYGSDVDASKALVEELGIADDVKWFPTMYRRELMIGLHLADVATGEFDQSYMIFGTIMEAMALGKPILHYRDDALYRASYPELYPLMNARTPEQISEALKNYADDPERYQQVGTEARRWFQTYIVEKPLQEVAAILGS